MKLTNFFFHLMREATPISTEDANEWLVDTEKWMAKKKTWLPKDESPSGKEQEGSKLIYYTSVHPLGRAALALGFNFVAGWLRSMSDPRYWFKTKPGEDDHSDEIDRIINERLTKRR